MPKREAPLSGVHALPEAGPVVLPCSAAGGRPNGMAGSWHPLVGFEPPRQARVSSGRIRRSGRGIMPATAR